MFGWDVADKLYDGLKLTGWDTGYTDAQIEILPFTCRELPLEKGTVLVQGQVVGGLQALCPRQVLNRVLKTANNIGFKSFRALNEFLVVDRHTTV